MKNKVLVTGGCGFIGSNFIKYLFEKEEDIEIVNLDKQTYAGQGKNVEHMGYNEDKRYKLIVGDVSDKKIIEEVFAREDAFDYVFNFAAESHVDRSWGNDTQFRKSNVFGTGYLLHAAWASGVEKFVHISTDEVYGSIKEGSFTEESEVSPTNPYSKCKVEAEVLVKHYNNMDLDTIITRSANNYGEYQFPEKLLSLFITNLIDDKKVPLMWTEDNQGMNIRDWLNVKDNVRAIWFAALNGKSGEIYNIAGENEKTNIEMTRKLLNYFNVGEEMIEKVAHRQVHDFRYSVDCSKLKKLGYTHKYLDLDKEVVNLCEWYKNNEKWWRKLKK